MPTQTAFWSHTGTSDSGQAQHRLPPQGVSPLASAHPRLLKPQGSVLTSTGRAPLQAPTPPPGLTDTYILIVQLRGAIPVVAQPAVLAVLPPGVVFAADAVHHIQEVDEAASVGVAVTFAVCEGGERGEGG